MRALWKRPKAGEVRVVRYDGHYSILELDHRTMRMLDLALCYLKDSDNQAHFLEQPSRAKVDDLHGKVLNALS